MFMSLSISKTIQKSILECRDARTFLKAVSGKSKNQRAHMVTHSYKGKKKFYGGKKYKPNGKKAGKPDGFIKAKGKDMKGKCFWYRQKGHMKIDCFKFENHLEGYADKSKGYRFYCPTYSMKIVESKRAVFLEEGADIGTNTQAMEFAFEEERSADPTLSTPSNIVIPPLLEHYDEPLSDQDDEPLPVIEEPQPIIYEPELVMDEPQPTVDEPQPVVDVPVRRSQRVRRSAIPGDYIVYLQEQDFDLGVDDDPRDYGQASSGQLSLLTKLSGSLGPELCVSALESCYHQSIVGSTADSSQVYPLIKQISEDQATKLKRKTRTLIESIQMKKYVAFWLCSGRRSATCVGIVHYKGRQHVKLSSHFHNYFHVIYISVGLKRSIVGELDEELDSHLDLSNLRAHPLKPVIH
ncbi:hypothetical protein EZV62_002907 [Acer yangbiense]|uniref:Uncharacterized protein n=1 Tax=Acer yangbiense TaxID=1000413 RepID=A0A5C7IYX2_9ROSI|nr:hypothetical protein EZV62_002907 [Acer yangbiense]